MASFAGTCEPRPVQRAGIEPDQLKATGLTARLAPAELRALAMCLQGRVYEAGETVFREGDPGDTMLIVISGRLVAVTSTEGNAGPTEQILNVMDSGEIVGEMALLDPAPRSATVRAIERSTVYALEHDAMDALRRASPAAFGEIIGIAVRDLARRLRRLDARIEAEIVRRRSEERIGARSQPTVVEATGPSTWRRPVPGERAGR